MDVTAGMFQKRRRSGEADSIGCEAASPADIQPSRAIDREEFFRKMREAPSGHWDDMPEMITIERDPYPGEALQSGEIPTQSMVNPRPGSPAPRHVRDFWQEHGTPAAATATNDEAEREPPEQMTWFLLYGLKKSREVQIVFILAAFGLATAIFLAVTDNPEILALTIASSLLPMPFVVIGDLFSWWGDGNKVRELTLGDLMRMPAHLFQKWLCLLAYFLLGAAAIGLWRIGRVLWTAFFTAIQGG